MNMDYSLRKGALRVGATLAAAALAFGLIGAGPAVAADQPTASLQLGTQGYDYKISAGGSPGKSFPVHYHGIDLKKPKLTFDFAGIASFARVNAKDAATVGAKCKVEGTSVVCDVAGLTEWTVLPLHIKPKAGAKTGQKGTITATVTADNLEHPATDSKTVTVTSGVDLVATEWHLDDSGNEVKPGDELITPVAVTNAGNLTAQGVQLTFRFSHGLVPIQYSDCTYAETRHATMVVCDLESVTLEPDFILTGVDIFSTVAADGYGNVTASYLAEADDVASDLPKALAANAKQGTGGKTLASKVVKKAVTSADAKALKPADVDDRDNFGGTAYTIKNTLDLAAVGAHASGSVGSTVKVKVGAENKGPGSGNTNRSGGEPFVVLELRLPEGTELVSVPANCGVDAEDSSKAQCYSADTLYVGESFLVELTLKITSATGNAAGLVSFFHRDNDPDASNDTANIVINPTEGGGGNLPVTGVQAGLIAITGVALLAAGFFLYTVARRRRVLLVTPAE
jgi:uncharacterized repeat protein (TIGR01451 family)